ncbi:MAG: multiprotein-bridging factor 1 family protein [Candidatus Aenigmatarchaeota archaeon]
MPECPLCGRKADRLVKVELEGAVVEACNECAKMGTRVEVRVHRHYPGYASVGSGADIAAASAATELVADYGARVGKARGEVGLTREELAKRINEQEAVLRRVERQEIEPDKSLTRKLEIILGITLREAKKE